MANKDRFYFDHDYNARNDDKILEMRSVYKAEGYGIFWMLVEAMVENEDGGIKASLMGGLSHGFGVTKEWLCEFIKYCVSIELFRENDGIIYSERIRKHKEFRQSFSEYGAKGAKKRWAGHSPPNANKRKGKENNKGVEFSADGLYVIFPDDTKQLLGPDQKDLLERKQLSPQSVIRNQIY